MDAESVGAEVAGGTDFQRNFAIGERSDQRGTANGGDTVADAFGAEDVDGVLDLFGASGLSGVDEEMKAVPGSEFVDGAEIGERDREFVAAKAESDNALVLEFCSDAGDFHGGSGTELANGVENELDLGAIFRWRAGCKVAREDFLKGVEIFGDVLLAEEHYADRESDFGVDHALFVQSGCRVLCELGVVFRFAEE